MLIIAVVYKVRTLQHINVFICELHWACRGFKISIDSLNVVPALQISKNTSSGSLFKRFYVSMCRYEVTFGRNSLC